MLSGPVQLLVLGFNHPDFHGQVIAEIERLRRSDAVRVINAVVVYKDAAGALEIQRSSDEAIELDFGHALEEQDEWDVIDDIPTDSAAALVLLEHRWAVPLCDAVAHAGYPISDGFIRTREGGNEMFGIRRVAARWR